MFCLVDNAAGIYLPKNFVEQYEDCIVNKDKIEEELDDLRNPDSEFYWDSWDIVLQDAILQDDKGKKYHLYQNDDGNLFAVTDEELEKLSEEF